MERDGMDVQGDVVAARKRRRDHEADCSLEETLKKVRITVSPGELRLKKDLQQCEKLVENGIVRFTRITSDPLRIRLDLLGDLGASPASSRPPPPTPVSVSVPVDLPLLEWPVPRTFHMQFPRFYPHEPPQLVCDSAFHAHWAELVDPGGRVLSGAAGLLDASTWQCTCTLSDVVTQLRQALVDAQRKSPQRRGRTALEGWFSGSKAVPRTAAATDLKEQLKALCVGTDNGVKASAAQKAEIEEVANQLNKLNPTPKPARSPLIFGRWRLLYSTVPGPSSGRIGPFVADVFQSIRSDRIFNELELGPSWAVRGALEADVEVVDDRNWAIQFDFVYNKFNGVEFQRKIFDRSMDRRIWEMTYMDDKFRVLYGRREGAPKEEESIFVLERC